MVSDCALLRLGDEHELFQQGQLFQKGCQQDVTVWTHTQWFFDGDAPDEAEGPGCHQALAIIGMRKTKRSKESRRGGGMEKSVDEAQCSQLPFARNLLPRLANSWVEKRMEMCLGHTTSARQKTRSGEVANSETAEVGDVRPAESMVMVWPNIHGLSWDLVVELCLVVHESILSTIQVGGWHIGTGRLG